MPGSVTLVGAGPAGPELLTLAGKEALSVAECVLYDRLVDPAILDFAPPEAERHYVGKQAGSSSHYPEQAAINELLVAKARAGLRVVRLKGGDPLMFARGGEELAALAAAGIPCRIVPGVTAALAAAAAALQPLTHRDAASAVAFFTGHLKPDQIASLDFAALARFPGTLVAYMPLAPIRPCCSSNGRPPPNNGWSARRWARSRTLPRRTQLRT
jgi:uroporphyrin-III C-methyltransferase